MNSIPVDLNNHHETIFYQKKSGSIRLAFKAW